MRTLDLVGGDQRSLYAELVIFVERDHLIHACGLHPYLRIAVEHPMLDVWFGRWFLRMVIIIREGHREYVSDHVNEFHVVVWVRGGYRFQFVLQKDVVVVEIAKKPRACRMVTIIWLRLGFVFEVGLEKNCVSLPLPPRTTAL
jgi:hypothetical protein